MAAALPQGAATMVRLVNGSASGYATCSPGAPFLAPSDLWKTRMTRRNDTLLVRLAAMALLGVTVSGCTSIGEEFHRGYLLDERALASVKPGMSAEQVLQTMGSPSTVSTVGNRNWYYISQTSARRVQFLGETVTDQKVAAVYFTPGLRVERVALYGIQDGKVFDFISRTTTSSGQEASFVGQLFDGLGPTFSPFGGR